MKLFAFLCLLSALFAVATSAKYNPYYKTKYRDSGNVTYVSTGVDTQLPNTILIMESSISNTAQENYVLYTSSSTETLAQIDFTLTSLIRSCACSDEICVFNQGETSLPTVKVFGALQIVRQGQQPANINYQTSGQRTLQVLNNQIWYDNTIFRDCTSVFSWENSYYSASDFSMHGIYLQEDDQIVFSFIYEADDQIDQNFAGFDHLGRFGWSSVYP